MRLTAYKKMIDSAFELPNKIEGQEYFGITINPQQDMMLKIITIARLDDEGLFNSEFVKLYDYVQNKSD